jgi:DNA-nicking Smr family endonuclease
MRRPRGLSREEAALWAKVAKTVAPLNPPRDGEGDPPKESGGVQASDPNIARAGPLARTPPPSLRDGSPPRSGEERPRPLDRHGLDGSWERKLAHGALAPDFTLDLHGHGLDAAHARLDAGLSQAAAMGARVVLVITGRPRPAEAADRGSRRGAIRAKLLDWLAAGPHGSSIAAVRSAHRRHGGAGAVYVVLRRPRQPVLRSSASR